MLAVPSGLSPTLLAVPRDTHNVLWAPLPVDQRALPLTPQITSSASPGVPLPGTRPALAMQSGDAVTPRPECTAPINDIVRENCLPGTARSVWDLPFTNIADAAGDSTIQGFTTEFSINKGPSAQVQFKVTTTAAKYRLEIYRMGYYDGMGARWMRTISNLTGVNQPNCLVDDPSGLVDCGNWSVSATWQVPPDAVSGIYFAKAIREDNGGASHIVFVIRDDEGTSDLLFQTADTTWQAYNDYGGNSLYTGSPAGRAYKVSYNRPFRTRAAGAGPHYSWVFSAEYPMVRWLEANGYDVSYISGIDTDRAGAELSEHRVFLSVGHDEYWSGAQRANVEAARDAGVHLAFFSGNEVFWKTRWEASIDNSNTPYRTLVTYKETHHNAKLDPETNIWTGTWRDPRPFNPEGPRPENALTGTIFTVNGERDDAIMVPAQFGRHRFWRNTSIATLPVGQTAILPQGTLGYEWDEDLDNGFRPAGLQRLSETTIDVTPKYLLDYGSNYGVGVATHALTLYRAASNALVFGAGTVQWSWGLDTDHDNPNNAQPSMEMRQATVNLFSDMAVFAGNLQPGLVQTDGTDDHLAPTSVIVSPPANSTVQSGDSIVISGTASDTGGGVLASVEVSVDGGTTWLPATGVTSWQFPWTATGNAPVTIKSRAIDDSGNVQNPAASRVINVTRTCPCGIWSDSAVPAIPDHDDPSALELGVKFQSDADGVVTGIRFYKGAGNTGTHVGSLWTSTGTKLADATFANETASGLAAGGIRHPRRHQRERDVCRLVLRAEGSLLVEPDDGQSNPGARSRERRRQRSVARTRERPEQWQRRVPPRDARIPRSNLRLEQLLGGRAVRAELELVALRQLAHPGPRRDRRQSVHHRYGTLQRGSRCDLGHIDGIRTAKPDGGGRSDGHV